MLYWAVTTYVFIEKSEDGSNDGSQNIFLCGNMANYPENIFVALPYLELWYHFKAVTAILFSYALAA